MDMPSFRLRDATASDAGFIYRLLDEAFQPHVDGSEVERRTARTARLLETADTSIVLVGEEAVGYLSVWRSADEYYVASIAITDAWRGRGLGTALLRDLIAEARSAGAPLRLSVFAANPARRLYERLGFLVTKVQGDKLRMELTHQRPA
jgi:ribosomal protein S18 acetylase RimI-like enzyme